MKKISNFKPIIHLETLCSQLDDFKELTDQRFKSQENALNLANKNMEMRLDKLNELRNEVLQDRSRYVLNEKFDIQYEILSNRIKALEMWQSRIYGIVIGTTVIGGIVGGVIGAIIK